MKNKRKISQKLNTLQELLNCESNGSSFDNERQNLKEALALLEDKELRSNGNSFNNERQIKGQQDKFGQPLYEEGLGSLIDTYQNPEDEEDND